MDSETLSRIAGVVLSLVFSYIPGLNTWFGALQSTTKQLVMGVLLVAVAAVIFGMSCAGIGSFAIACTVAGAYGFFQVLIVALVANQATYLITKK